MDSILLTTGSQSLVLSGCIYFSSASSTELPQSLAAIGCVCLFVWMCSNILTSSLFASSAANANQTSCSKDSAMVHQPEPSKICNSVYAVKQSPLHSMVPSPSNAASKIRSVSKRVMHDKIETAASTSSLPSDNSVDERVPKRTDYLDWNEYFFSVAMLSAMRSKDPSTQVGACIVNTNKRIVGIGYNGFPKTLANNDDELPWNRQSSLGVNHTKYPYVCHAEMNAILNKNNASCENCTIYVVLFPCNECAKMIIQCGIKKVVYICDKYAMTDKVKASKTLFKLAGVEYIQYVPQNKSVLITFPNAD